MAQFVANPRVTFNIVQSENRVGPDDQRCLIIGQLGEDATEAAGSLVVDVPRSDAAINALFDSSSMLAMIARAYRSVNKVTNVDALPLADAGSSTAATSSFAFTGTATADGTLFASIVSKQKHRYQIDVLTGDTAASIATKLVALTVADRYLPFTSAASTGTVTNTAVNTGTHANDWHIELEGSVPGIACTVTGWASGATDPVLTTLFDPIETLRYQTIIWPAKYDITKVKTLLNARKNVDNNIMDGMAFTYRNVSFSTIKSLALSTNSSEVLVMTNEPNALAKLKGPHIPEAPDVIAAKVAAALDLRFEPDVGISNVVVTNAPNDQFGGIHTASLPAFNTPLLDVQTPQKGTGYTLEEQAELEAAGVSVLGVNRQWNQVITGVMVTTWLNDAAGNPDNTWKFLEWRRTHGMIREYLQRNCQKEFRQHRLTPGTAVSGYAMVDEPGIRSFIALLYQELTQVALTVSGLEARKYFEANLSVQIIPGRRQAKVAAKCPMVSQLGEIIGSIEYTFETI
jgi:phage tail sheath gpL-like